VSLLFLCPNSLFIHFIIISITIYFFPILIFLSNCFSLSGYSHTDPIIEGPLTGYHHLAVDLVNFFKQSLKRPSLFDSLISAGTKGVTTSESSIPFSKGEQSRVPKQLRLICLVTENDNLTYQDPGIEVEPVGFWKSPQESTACLTMPHVVPVLVRLARHLNPF
jgi:hypothetical protein